MSWRQLACPCTLPCLCSPPASLCPTCPPTGRIPCPSRSTAAAAAAAAAAAPSPQCPCGCLPILNLALLSPLPAPCPCRDGKSTWEDLNLDDVDVRLKWAGLFHRRKRTPGRFMMRLKASWVGGRPGGLLLAESVVAAAGCGSRGCPPLPGTHPSPPVAAAARPPLQFVCSSIASDYALPLPQPQVPNGELTAAQLRYLGDCIAPYGEDGCADITTRANIQLRGVTLEDADRIIAGLLERGLTSFMVGAGGWVVGGGGIGGCWWAVGGVDDCCWGAHPCGWARAGMASSASC